MKLEHFNELGREQCHDALRQCCVSTRWIEQMAQARPFSSADQLYQSADRIWQGLAMPIIWRPLRVTRRSVTSTPSRPNTPTPRRWPAVNRPAPPSASDAVLQALAEGNAAYEKRFGFIFIVCASGKSAEEMLQLLQQRLSNDLETELKIAAGEQAKITRLRLHKMLDEEGGA